LADSSRIEELRRRVQLDPASIAFAALAEEYRRAGQYDESIATCLAGLQRHPAYLSARVTLGRSLLELGRYDEARQQLEHVLRAAPENLAAIRGLAEIHRRTGDLADREHASAQSAPAVAAPSEPARQQPPAAADPAADPRPAPAVVVPIRPVPVQLSRVVEDVPQGASVAPQGADSAPPSPPPISPEPEHVPHPPAVAPEPIRLAPTAVQARRIPHPDEAALPALEAFLAAILRTRDDHPPARSPRR
jgi:tetratricopeptide (TPR) repeat protein